jgi:nucleoside 2-deoxyribosyltransferase
MITGGFCLIGDIVVDISLSSVKGESHKMRLGGLCHAARAVWALNHPHDVAYVSPAYLDKSIETYLKHHSASYVKLGNVIGSPYVFLIQEVKEIGDQGYEFILHNQVEITLDAGGLENLKNKTYNDILFITGNFPLIDVIPHVQETTTLHIDLANDFDDLSFLTRLARRFKTIFISTSSNFFKSTYKDDFLAFAMQFSTYCDRFVLKENRGGSRAIEFSNMDILHIPSQTKSIVHSVGVGDVFDSAYVTNYQKYSFFETLVLSSWIAAEYASTTYPDDFKKSVLRIMKSNLCEIIDLGGISVPWEVRKLINIYVAAPDFHFVNTDPIDALCESLKYHNFSPRRPVQENGQMPDDASIILKREIFNKDMALLNECKILIAVLLYNDPGTLIEIGLSVERGMPTIVYDPYGIAKNCMLTQIPNFLSNDLDKIISEVFTIANNFK